MVVVPISTLSYDNFISSFKLNKGTFGMVTVLESRVHSLFHVDYGIAAKATNADVREDFYNYATDRMVDEFSDPSSDLNLWELIDYRHSEYAGIAATGGETWIQGILTLYEHRLKASDSGSFEKRPPLKFEDAVLTAPARAQFISGEADNLKTAAGLVNDLLE